MSCPWMSLLLEVVPNYLERMSTQGNPLPHPKHTFSCWSQSVLALKIFVRTALGKIVPLPRCLMESASGIIMIKNGGGYCLLGRAFS